MTTYVVVTVAEDGTLNTWGPFRSETRADDYAASFDPGEVDAAVHMVHTPEPS